QGGDVAFLQGSGSVSQTADFAAGTYTLGLLAAQRGNQTGAETFRVLVDGNVVGTFNNLTGAGYTALATSTFTLTAGSHAVAFLQGSGSMSQAVTFAAGTYDVGFAAAQRGNIPALQTFQVLVDGKVVGTFNNLGGSGYTALATSTFTVTAGSHVVAFRGTNLL